MRADAESNDNRGQPCQPMNLLNLRFVCRPLRHF